jgi:hypothetical protein
MGAKQSVFIDTKGNIVARGWISELCIDLTLVDGSRFYSTRSDGFAINFIKSLNIVKVEK